MQPDPKFKAWFDARQRSQHTSAPIPTRNANPTRAAGPKNSNGSPAKGAPHAVKKLATKTAVGRPKGKVNKG